MLLKRQTKESTERTFWQLQGSFLFFQDRQVVREAVLMQLYKLILKNHCLVCLKYYPVDWLNLNHCSFCVDSAHKGSCYKHYIDNVKSLILEIMKSGWLLWYVTNRLWLISFNWWINTILNLNCVQFLCDLFMNPWCRIKYTHATVRIKEYIKWHVYNSYNRAVTVTVWKKGKEKLLIKKTTTCLLTKMMLHTNLNCALYVSFIGSFFPGHCLILITLRRWLKTIRFKVHSRTVRLKLHKR